MERITHSPINLFYKIGLFLLVTLIFSFSGYSQNVAINTSGNAPNSSAGLDVDFPNMGVLIPRVALTGTANAAPLAAHVAGMIVYNTATTITGTADVKPGFYYNDGTKWITGFPLGASVGDMLYWNGTAWVLVPAGLPGQYLQMSGGTTPAWNGAALAALTTTAASSITGFAAMSGGNITSDGGSPVISRGVCWKTTTGPTIADSKTIDGAGLGTFVSTIGPLLPVTTYYVRAYAVNSNVNNYGNEISFTTLPIVPTLDVTTAATLITGSTATTGGNVTNTGGASILERGVCYSTSPNPTTANPKVIDAAPGLGVFTSNLTGLTGNTIYYVRSYAINSAGTAYGAQVQFTTLVNLPVLVTLMPGPGTTATSAIGGGTATQNGGGRSFGNYGIAYSTVSNAPTPTFVSSGFGYTVLPASWSTNITGLTGNTTYYIRAYLDVYDPTAVWGTPAWSTVYGNELSFTTLAPTLPIVASTNAITGISDRTGISGGIITTDGGAAITAKGVCWSTSPSPVLGTNNFTNDISTYPGSTPFTSNIANLTGNTTYYVRAYATNSVGTTYGPADVSFTTWVTAPYTLGQNLGYGYCAYIDPTGHGFIVSNDIPFTGEWGCSGTSIATGTALGTGLANTNAILAGCPSRPIAASVATAYTGGGFTDWYLPSSGEWSKILDVSNLVGLGYVNYNNYYTSSESTATYAATAWCGYGNNRASTAAKAGGANQYINFLRVIRNF